MINLRKKKTLLGCKCRIIWAVQEKRNMKDLKLADTGKAVGDHPEGS